LPASRESRGRDAESLARVADAQEFSRAFSDCLRTGGSMSLRSFLRAPRTLVALVGRLRNQRGGRDVIRYLTLYLGVSRESAIAAAKRLKMALSPVKAWRRRRAAASAAIRVPEDAGWLKLPPGVVTGGPALAAALQRLFESKKQHILETFKPPYGFVIQFKAQGDTVLLEQPDEFKSIVRFCSQKPLLDLLASYIGEFPVLSGVTFAYTPPWAGRVGSQLFHRDRNEPRQLHLVMPIWPVDMESGPFTFIPAKKSAEIVPQLDLRDDRFIDEQVFDRVSESEFVYCTGDPGDIYLVNPCACIHCGARTKSKPRLLLILNFTSLFEGAEGQFAVYRAENRRDLSDGSPEVQALLNL